MRDHIDASRLEQVLAGIDTLDLEAIKLKLRHDEDGHGWTGEHANRIELAYRRFLMLLAKYPQLQMAPTRDIDAFWHTHILDTRKYAADCQRVFGGFVHHQPTLRPLDGQAQAQVQQPPNALNALFVIEFGEEVPDNAARAAKSDASAAWCAGEIPRVKAAAWCAGELPRNKDGAWCAGELPHKKDAAWCAGELPHNKAAAWCAGELPQNKDAAWCAGELPRNKDAAWCAGELPRNKDAAWCAGELPRVAAESALND